MKPQANGLSRAHKANNTRVEGTNWILIAAGALLSTLSIRFGYKLKQAVDSKPKQNSANIKKGRYILLGGFQTSVFCISLLFLLNFIFLM